MTVGYKNASGVRGCTIVEAHLDDMLEPYYTIRLEDGREKQTDDAHIRPASEEKDNTGGGGAGSPPPPRHRSLTLTVPPGPLGATVRRDRAGRCVVSSVANPASPLRADDVIVSLNGAELARTDDGAGPHLWVTLFRSTAGYGRTLAILRREGADVRVVGDGGRRAQRRNIQRRPLPPDESDAGQGGGDDEEAVAVAIVADETPEDGILIAPPPPISSTARRHAERLSRTRAPGFSSPLPDPALVRHCGRVLSRISLRAVIMKRWKPTFWIQYGPSRVLFFRSFDDYDDWLNNPYHTTRARESLVKLRVDFKDDFKRGGVVGYQVTQVRRKPYGKNVM